MVQKTDKGEIRRFWLRQNDDSEAGKREQLNAKARRVGRVCLVLLTDLIIRFAGKLLCQVFLWAEVIGGVLVMGILEGFGGLTRGFC